MGRRMSLYVADHPDVLSLSHSVLGEVNHWLSNVVDLEGRPLLSHVFGSKTGNPSDTSELLTGMLPRWSDGNRRDRSLVAGVKLCLQTVDLLLSKIPVDLGGRTSSIGLAVDAGMKRISLDETRNDPQKTKRCKPRQRHSCIPQKTQLAFLQVLACEISRRREADLRP